MNDCICLITPTTDTAVGWITGTDGMLWIYGPVCRVHHEPAVSPIWHPAIGWLDRETEEPATADTVPALMEV